MLVIAILATVTVGINEGWKIPGIGSVGESTGSGFNSTSSSGSGTINCNANGVCTYQNGTPVCTYASCPSGSVLPTGEVAYNTQLVAVYSDGGANSTISSQSGVPTFAQIEIGGRPLNYVDAQFVVGYISSVPLPAGTTVTFVINETALNTHTFLETWKSYTDTIGFVDNNTVSLFLLPHFAMPAVQVFADECNTNSTGGWTCNLPSSNSTIQTRRVQWNIETTVTVRPPGGLSVLPLEVTGSTFSEADLNLQGAVGCTNCGIQPSPTLTATLTPNRAEVQLPSPSHLGPKPAGNPYEVPGSGQVSPGGQVEVCDNSECHFYECTGADCQLQVNEETAPVGKPGSGQGSPEGVGGNGGAGINESAKQAYANGDQVKGYGRFSLLPLPGGYITLSLGSFEVINTWALAFFAIVWVAVAAGIIAIIVLWRRL